MLWIRFCLKNLNKIKFKIVDKYKYKIIYLKNKLNNNLKIYFFNKLYQL